MVKKIYIPTQRNMSNSDIKPAEENTGFNKDNVKTSECRRVLIKHKTHAQARPDRVISYVLLCK